MRVRVFVYEELLSRPHETEYDEVFGAIGAPPHASKKRIKGFRNEYETQLSDVPLEWRCAMANAYRDDLELLYGFLGRRIAAWDQAHADCRASPDDGPSVTAIVMGEDSREQDEFSSPQEEIVEFKAAKPAAPASARCSPSFWFYHIGKTGGSTIVKRLKQLLRKQHAFTFVDLSLHQDKGWQESWPPFDVLTAESREPLMGWLDARPVKSPTFHERLLLLRRELRKPRPTFSVHHHHNMPGMNGTARDMIRPLRRYLNARGCDLKVGVVLRDSVDRVTSISRYHSDFDGSHVSIQAANVHDGQCQYLLYNHRLSSKEPPPVCDFARADDILQHDVDFVGTTDRLDDFWTCVVSSMTWPRVDLDLPRSKYNANPHAMEALSTEDQQRIRERNTLDARLLETHGGKCRVTAPAEPSS